MGVIRHLITTGGGALVAAGIMDIGTATAIGGGLIATIGFIWSIMSKK